MLGNIFKSRWVQVILVAGISFAAASGLLLTGALQGFELAGFDGASRLLNPARPDVSDVVMVNIDQHSIDTISDQFQVTWIWPRGLYVHILDFLSQAKAIFVDILYTEPSNFGVSDDMRFAAGIQAAGNVHLPVFLTAQDRPMSDQDRQFLSSLAVTGVQAPEGDEISATVPIAELQAVLAMRRSARTRMASTAGSRCYSTSTGREFPISCCVICLTPARFSRSVLG